MFKAKHNICCVYVVAFRKRNKCHFPLEHINKSKIPSTFSVTVGETKTWNTFLLTCLLLFDVLIYSAQTVTKAFCLRLLDYRKPVKKLSRLAINNVKVK